MNLLGNVLKLTEHGHVIVKAEFGATAARGASMR